MRCSLWSASIRHRSSCILGLLCSSNSPPSNLPSKIKAIMINDRVIFIMALDIIGFLDGKN
ncbi:MAG: hypothetical protein METHAR1v1_1680003 [Methanothrix sp.]|nr:MAG: hypothetical protein METHAR1v1_1680003 [Methanothrix sp.]